MQDELRRLHRELGTTFVFVTHDQEEALALSSNIAIFNQGRLQQLGSPSEVYERPSNRFVAEFLGDINILPVEGVGRDAKVEGQAIALPAPQGSARSHVAIRPEHMRLARPGEAGNALPMRLVDQIYLGAESRLQLQTRGGVPIVLNIPNSATPNAIEVGSEVLVGWDAQNSFLI
ncbi:ABC transporter ATP-binding protein [Paracoccus sp. MBLB3053]|uniref:ABC transporter ATP-binding protein n=2 Tax=Paracoccus aurantius TaxID=3073814 RepID=A0ABU2HWA8_9RHOB|nr:ABC transporter ATP-binding protein [Paracoccus sp. MBLB3053]MDS9469308.1 ABC transporter ATP-binding protein [Paracoccus sp. MBLB3053]